MLDKLIIDPLKKAEFYMLQGDKRVAMGIMLDGAGKPVLGEEAISKAEKYMNNAVQILLEYKAQGKGIPGRLVDKLTQSLAKHAEVLHDQIAKASGAQKTGLSASLTLVEQLQSDLSKLR